MYKSRIIVACLYLLSASCGVTSQKSELLSFDELVFLPNNIDPANRIGFDGKAAPIAAFGRAVGSEFIIDYGTKAVWTPLHRLVNLRGSSVMVVPVLEFNVSNMPVYPDEDDNPPQYIISCSDHRWDPQNHNASFVVRTRYKQNGVEKILYTPAIPVSHRTQPRYPATERPGRVKLEAIYDGGGITDLSIEIGMVVPRVAVGYCTEDDGGVSRDVAASGSAFNIRLARIIIPHAENK